MRYFVLTALVLLMSLFSLSAQHPITGSWLLKKISSEKTSRTAYILFLNEDKTFKIFQQQHIASSGHWSVNDNNTLILTFTTGEETHYPLKRVQPKTLVLIDDNKTVFFKRLYL